jgi:hypothetical protein
MNVAARFAELRGNEVYKILQERGCLTDVAHDGDDYLISQHTCPFPNVAARNSAVCALDVEFVRRLVGKDARLTTHRRRRRVHVPVPNATARGGQEVTAWRGFRPRNGWGAWRVRMTPCVLQHQALRSLLPHPEHNGASQKSRNDAGVRHRSARDMAPSAGRQPGQDSHFHLPPALHASRPIRRVGCACAGAL